MLDEQGKVVLKGGYTFYQALCKKEVKAKQWFPDRPCDEVTFPLPFLNDEIKGKRPMGRDCTFEQVGKIHFMLVCPGDWLILRGNGGIDVLPDAEFRAKYAV